MKKIGCYCILGGIFLFLLCYPSQAMEAATRGLELCASTVIPSLFPFFIVSSLFIKTGFLSVLFRPLQGLFAKLFGISPAGAGAFFLGACAGYPIGAKSVSELTATGQISKAEGTRLLGFCNNAGPLFLVGTVGVGMFGSADCGYLLLISHLLAAMTVGILFRKKQASQPNIPNQTPAISWNVLSDSVNKAVNSILGVCGYIILFQVIIKGLYQFGIISFFANLLTAEKAVGFANGVLSGFLEMTTGVHILSQLHRIPLRVLLTAASTVIGFGGLCVHAQTFGIIKEFHKKTYLTGKLLQGMFSGIFTYFLYPKLLADVPVFYTRVPTQQELNGELYLTLFLLLVTLLFYVIVLFTDFFRSKK